MTSSGIYKHKCKCGKTFIDGNGFSSHRCQYKKNAGAFIATKAKGKKTFKLTQDLECHKSRVGECDRHSNGGDAIIFDDQGFAWCHNHFPDDGRLTNTGLTKNLAFNGPVNSRIG